jgi:hypothetical protein
MLAFLRRHPALVFIAMVFPLSWHQWLLGFANEPGDSGLNPLAPLVAALLAAGLTGGWRACLELLTRAARVWARPSAWAVAVLAPICAVTLAVGLMLVSEPLGAGQLRARSVHSRAK